MAIALPHPPSAIDTASGFGVVHETMSPAALQWANVAVNELVTRPGGVGSQLASGFPQVVGKLGAVALYLMGLPAVVEVARACCGPTATPSHDWMVIKNPGDGRKIEWHQDFVHSRRFLAISVGIHLDEMRADALRVIPSTHRQAQDLCQLREQFDYDSPGVVALPTSAGGVVWHDVMTVHGSPALPAAAPARKTVYIEFRAREALDEHPGFPPNYVALRAQLFDVARRVHRRLGARPQGDPWNALEGSERELIDTLRTVAAQVDLARYCTPTPLPA